MFGTNRTDGGDKKWSRRRRVVAATVGALLSGTAAYGASTWVVGVNAGSSGAAQSATVSNLTIAAVATPAAGNVLYPGATGDVVLQITNPNAFPVTVTDVQLPASSTFAAGFSDAALTTPQVGCAATTPSGVSWNFATAVAGSSHPLVTPLTIGRNGTLTVTLTNDAVMSTTAPVACAGTYFSMPSLAGVTASADNAAATASPATDSWTS
jgi:hypothetical protein